MSGPVISRDDAFFGACTANAALGTLAYKAGGILSISRSSAGVYVLTTNPIDVLEASYDPSILASVSVDVAIVVEPVSDTSLRVRTTAGGVAFDLDFCLRIWRVRNKLAGEVYTPSPSPTVPTGGDVTGPASSTDNAVVRWNGTTGRVVQDSGVLIDDDDNLTAPGRCALGTFGDPTRTVFFDGLISSSVTFQNGLGTYFVEPYLADPTVDGDNLIVEGGLGGDSDGVAAAGAAGTTQFLGAGGGNGSGAFPGRDGGLARFRAGPGGNGTAAAAAGRGGDTIVEGAMAGANLGGGGNDGGDAVLRGGVATGAGVNGQVTVGADNTRQVLICGATTPLGFFAHAASTQPTSGADLTNNVTSGGVNNTIADYGIVDYATDGAAIRNNIYQLARKLAQVNNGLRTLGLLS